MAIEGGSDSGGAPGPARMSDLGVGGSTTRSATMSDLGPGTGGPIGPGAAAPGDKMTPLKMEDLMKPAPPNTGEEGQQGEETEAEAQPEAEQQTEEQEPGVLTPEQQAAKYQEWMDSDNIPDEFLDRPIWVPDGKNGQVPIRLRDVPNNIMLYTDYQKKTTEVAQQRRQNEQFLQGRNRWVEDMNSGDADRGLRAIRGIGAEKTLEQIVVKFVQNMAQLEGLPPQLQQQFLEGQRARDEAFFAKQQLEAIQRQQLAAQQQQEQQQGVNSPDIKYVTDYIERTMPEIFKANKIEATSTIEYILSNKLAQAAQGVRDPQTKQWIEPPTIQLGRAPSKALLTRLAIAAKQEADAMVANQSRPLNPPPPTPQLRGSGPAARPGQKGNISSPQQARFSDLANSRRPG